MGANLSFWRKREVGLLMVGPDYAGKTKILYKLKFPGLVCQSIATTGFNVETIRIKDREFTMWDISGQFGMRPLWSYYYNYVDGLIFVVDSTDSTRGDEARSALEILIQAVESKGKPLLVFANKQDVHQAMTVAEVRDLLGLTDIEDRVWHIVGTSADTGKGLIEGLEWMATQLTEPRS
ncbi:hypothetical protein BGZ51_002965 [Haplosporangium sp. Z 767]|nr:hypothetical protein BGZ51_002965 [Haplosporangium sp. Z 767]KAF9196880.1 hypothetical protein BGZ50_005955 [Haplosporangium sp. Z 11]